MKNIPNISPCQQNKKNNISLDKSLFDKSLQPALGSDTIYSRQTRRSKAYYYLQEHNIDMRWFMDFWYNKQKYSPATIAIFRQLIFFAAKGLYFHPSVGYLQRLTAVDGKQLHANSIKRITAALANVGMIRKYYRGMKRSVVLLLNPIFNNPIIQYVLSGIFPFFRAWAAALFLGCNNPAQAKSISLFSPSKYKESKGVTYMNVKDSSFKSCSLLNDFGSKKDSSNREISKRIGERETFSCKSSICDGQNAPLPPRSRSQEEYVAASSVSSLLSVQIALYEHSYNGVYEPAVDRTLAQRTGDFTNAQQAPHPQNAPTARKDVVHENQEMAMNHYVMQRIADSIAQSVTTTSALEYHPALDTLTELNVTPFGKAKLSIIPEMVVVGLYEYLKQQQKLPKAEEFFEKCVEYCKMENICLKAKFSKFYKMCQDAGIDPKKAPFTIKKVEVWKEAPVHQSCEKDFWTVEQDVYANPAKWQILGYIPNPWQAWMDTNAHKHQRLYTLYKEAHQTGQPDMEKLAYYHQALAYSIEKDLFKDL